VRTFPSQGPYNFDRIRYDYYRDGTVALEGLFADKYDFRAENSAKNWATAYTSPAVKKGDIVRQEVRSELPSGMQGFVLNTRREIFKDPRVRQALALAFDFEWGNRTWVQCYQRTTVTSPIRNWLLRVCLGDELKLLDKLRADSDEVSHKLMKPRKRTGSGDIRENLARQAPFLLKPDGRSRTANWDASGKPFTFEIVDSSPLFEPGFNPFCAIWSV
jgi:microcin C transport system substrate-binding protein